MRRRKQHTIVVEVVLLCGCIVLFASAVRAQDAPPPPPAEELPAVEDVAADAEQPVAEGEPPEAQEEAPPAPTEETAPVPEEEKTASATIGVPPPATWDDAKDPDDDELDDKLDVISAGSPKDHLVIKKAAGGKDQVLLKVIGVMELHSNIISDDYSANDWSSFYMLKLNADLTKYDQLSLRMDMDQMYIADENENGLWFGDMRFYYTRKFKIPIPGFAIPAKASLYVTAPTSRASQSRSYITKPTAILTMIPSIWDLSLVTQGFFRYSIAEYAETGDEAGTLNTMLTTGFVLQLIYSPVDWFAPYFVWQNSWDKAYDSLEGESQPWLGAYGFEAALDFAIPLGDAWPNLDLILAYNQGARMLSDGVNRMYFGKRDQAQMYFGINIVY